MIRAIYRPGKKAVTENSLGKCLQALFFAKHVEAVHSWGLPILTLSPENDFMMQESL